MIYFSIEFSWEKMNKLSLGIIVVIVTIRLAQCLPLEDQKSMERTSLILYNGSGTKQIHQSNGNTVQQLNNKEGSNRRGFEIVLGTVLPMVVTILGGVLTQLILKI